MKNKWYKFWSPDSGLIGGMIFGAIIAAFEILMICLIIGFK